MAGEARDWELHKCLIFDDSFEHEVKLPTFTEPEVRDSLLDEARVVLLLDLWHPDAGFLKEAAESRAVPRAKELSDKRLKAADFANCTCKPGLTPSPIPEIPANVIGV